MSMRYIAPVVAEANPNLYAAAQRANLSPAERNQIEQMSWAIKKNRELSRMRPEVARREYDSLDPDVQETLKFFYSNAEYMKEPPDFSDRAVGTLKFVGKTLASPLIGLFKVAGAYNRILNTPYLVYRQITQGESIFDAKVWSDSWDGKDIYDNGALAEAIDNFGKEKVFVARQLLQGRRPGEILEAYGDLTPGIVNAMTEAFNDPDSFKQVMDATKYAQVSPGRDIARIMDTKPPKNGGPAGDYIDGTTKNVSGAIDFMYQILIDPLTWITGGTSKAITRGSQLAEMATKAMNAGDSSAMAVSRVFADDGVRKLWDEQIGPDLKRLADATNDAERASIRKFIGRRYSGYNNDEAIDFFVRNKMFDATQAEKIFGDAENTMLLLSGRLDGISFKRNGVATARNQRRLTYGLNKLLDDVFNATTSKTGIRKTTDELNAKGEEAFAVLSKSGEEVDKAINPALREVLDIDKDVSLFRRTLLAVGRAAARNPGGQPILTGDNAIKTADSFRQVARQVLSRDLAEFTTQKFLRSTEDEQVVIIRNLYGAIMMRAGLEGTPAGREFMEQILSKTLNEKAGFTTTSRTPISEEIAKLLSPHTVRIQNGQAELLRSGAIQPSQLANAIAPLPYEEIAAVAYAVRTKNIQSKRDLIYAIGGATQNRLARNFVDFWSVFTLFPRLGIRSAIDEGFMYAMTAPLKDLYQFAVGVGRKFGRGTTAYTGSKEASPLITDKFRKLFGRKVPLNEIPLAERNLIIENKVAEINAFNKLADDLAVTPSELSHLAINKEVADRASVFLKGLSNDEKAWWAELMIHHPDTLGAMASSVAAKTISGKLDEPFTTQQINVSELTRALQTVSQRLRDSGKIAEKDALSYGDWKKIEIDELAKADPVYLTLAHYDNWFIRFAVPRQHGALKLDGPYRVSPATVFFANNGLKTPKDLERAVGEIMQSVGIEFIGDAYRIKKAYSGGTDQAAEAAVKKFLSYFGDTVTYRQQGLPDEEIVRIFAEGMLLDMRNTFHGTTDFARYNGNLYDAIRNRFDELKMRTEQRPYNIPGITPTLLDDSNLWQKAAASIDIDKFDDLTKDFKLDGFINTRIDFQEFTDLPSIFRVYGNKMMELMDRQLTSILRQPIVGVTYLKYRKMYVGLQREWTDQYVKREIASNPEKYATPGAKEQLQRRAALLGQKRFAEIAMNEAVDQVLKYADNPSIRSNFALSVRTVGRFYRATEDFYRRVYRLKDVSAQMLYRMRLAHVGLNASGDVYEDAEGKPYIMMPMDNVIFKATDTTLRVLTGQSDSLYKQPMFNDFTLKLELANPSFAPEAGVPQFSGPIAALGVIGIKNLLGNFDSPLAQKAAENVDNFALGQIGDNITVRRAIVPSTLAKLWTMVDANEKDRQEVTAAQQAIAYNAANGIYLNPSATDREKADYLKNIRISAHNILFMRSVLGLISPVAPTMQESQGVPEYLLDVGIAGLRPEFFDILESIQKKYGDDVQDPYEMALSMFTGKYPGKIVYTVSRNENQTKVLIKSTEEMKNWALENRKLIKVYGEAAYVFAPRTGEFNAAAYNWLQANDLIKDKSLEQYFDDVQVAEDKQRYYDIAAWERDNMNTEGRVSERQYIMATATAAREGLLNSNPLLLRAITGGGNEIATEQNLMRSIREITNDMDAPIDAATRMRMRTALQAMDDFIAFAESPDVKALYNSSYLKREYRNRTRSILADLGSGDFAVREATRASFNSILTYYSRDTFKAVP